MTTSIPSSTLEKFTTFGDLLRFLRRRMGITQTELALAVGYSHTQISRLEQNLRPPDIPTIEARFVPALGLEQEPKAVARLLDLAANIRREDAPALGLCPYKGLNYFDEADADLFVGREALIAKLVERVLALTDSASKPRFLAVVGASGSGKSSLVRAGLVPALRWNKTSTDWQIHVCTPTAHPLESLAANITSDSNSVIATSTLIDNLAREPRSLQLLIKRQLPSENPPPALFVIDQFEEVFALCRSEEERASFIENLLTASSETECPVIVVITLRADFYAHCANYIHLREALAKNQEYIGAMSADQLRRAIEEPARRGRWEFEPGLVDLLLHDVGQEPGALPLLSHALFETWQRRRGRIMTMSGYASSGGVRGAIAETAETVFNDQFTLEQRSIARRIFLRLTELGDETSTADTRRRASFNELILKPEETSATQAVLKTLADARLIITSEDAAEVAHEALIREWPTLRGWLEENREGLRLHRQLTEAVQEWNAMNHSPDILYRGVRLAQTHEWAATHVEEMNALENEFLAASIAASEHENAEREAQRQRELTAAKELAETQRQSASRLRIRNRVITIVASVAVILAMLAGLLRLQSNRNAISAQNNAATAEVARDEALNAKANAQAERDRADEAALLSFSRELAVQAKLNLTVDPERSILLALAALDQAHTQEAETVLHEAVLASRLRLTLRGHEESIEDMTYSPDGKLIATASLDQTARLWDATTGKELFRLQHPDGVGHVAFTPDGSRLATGAGDGLVRLWDVASGTESLTIPAAPKATRDIFLAQFMDFSPDGRLLATTADYATEVKFWDPATGDELFVLSDPAWQAVAPGIDLVPIQIRFSPDGTRLAIGLGSGDAGLGRIELWDVATRQKVQTMAGRFRFDPIFPMAFSPDGTRLVITRGVDDRSTVWDVASGNLLFSLKDEDSGQDIHYSVDGKRLLSASPGGKVKMFDAETGDELLALVGHSGILNKVSERPGCVQPPTAPFAWCGTYLASASTDGTVRVWDISPTGGEELLTLPGSQFALNQDGTRLTTVLIPPYNSEGTTVSIQAWDLPAGPQSVESSGYDASSIEIGAGYQWTLLFPGGILGAGFDSAPYRFWDVLEGGKVLYSISCCFWENSIDLSISGRQKPRAAIGDSRTGTVMIWDLVRDEQIRTIQVAEPHEFQRVFLAPDGERFVTLNFDTSVETWDVNTGQRLLTSAGPATVSAVSSLLWFSPDGKWLVIAGCDGTVVVRDVVSGEVKLTFSGNLACIRGVAFSPDGKLFAINAGNRGLKILDFETGQELLTLTGGFDVEFTPDGTRVITATLDEGGQQIVRTYLLRLDDIVALAKTRVTRSLTTEECQNYLHMEQCPSKP